MGPWGDDVQRWELLQLGSGLTGTLLNVADAGGTVGTTPDFLNGPNNFAVNDINRVQRDRIPSTRADPGSTEFRLNFNF